MAHIKRGKSKHPRQTKTPEVITYRLIHEFKREPLNEDNTSNQIVWWIVEWCRSGSPVFEKRRIYKRKDGVTRTCKQMPLNIEDIEWIADNFDEIQKHLKGA